MSQTTIACSTPDPESTPETTLSVRERGTYLREYAENLIAQHTATHPIAAIQLHQRLSQIIPVLEQFESLETAIGDVVSSLDAVIILAEHAFQRPANDETSTGMETMKGNALAS